MLTQFMKNFKFRKILYFLTLIFELVYDILERGFFMKRNWWNIYFDNWVNHCYLVANMYVCSTTWLKITIKHSSDIFFCNFPWFFPLRLKNSKKKLSCHNLIEKVFRKKNKLFLHFSSLLQLLLLEPYHHYHPNVPNLNYYAKKNKKETNFLVWMWTKRNVKKGFILFFSMGDFSTINVFFFRKTR